MQEPNLARVRMGAPALGLSALLLTVFPLVRPFFPLDPFPRALRIIDGFFIGLGGLWLATDLWQAAEDAR